jgi:diguanylate cyclase (GGDEF)-like protein
MEKNLARKDMLTGAANRRLFFELAEVEIRRSRRYKHPFTLAYIDLDNFKKVNDTQGHNAGDNVLKVVVETIRKNIREIDLISRLSGDEFVILLPETNLSQAKVVIERTQKGLLFAMQKNSWPVTFSIGVITFEKVPSTADEMVKVADNLMYEVKKSGKNNIRYDVWQE